MNMPKLNSQYPNTYDNTEKDLILVSPSVLDNKLRDFENYGIIKTSIKGDVALALALFIAVFTVVEFVDLLPPIITASTLRGAFVVAFLVMIVKIAVDIRRIRTSPWGSRTRGEIIDALLGRSTEVHKDTQRSEGGKE